MVSNIPNTPFFIVSKFNKRVLDVEGASTKDNAKICVWKQKDNSDNKNQLWEYRDGNFINVNSGKVLDIKGHKVKSDGKSIHVFSLQETGYSLVLLCVYSSRCSKRQSHLW